MPGWVRFTLTIPAQNYIDAHNGLEKLLRPAIIQILVDSLLATQLGDALLAPQARNHNPDFFFSRVLPPRCAPDIPHNLLSFLGVPFY